jgi:hypothetical protein
MALEGLLGKTSSPVKTEDLELNYLSSKGCYLLCASVSHFT